MNVSTTPTCVGVEKTLISHTESGAAIIYYSTDYDELIGCCDRVLVLYDGAVKRELVGAEITERALIASALNIQSGEVGLMPASAS